jgi:hypothetical protein
VDGDVEREAGDVESAAAAASAPFADGLRAAARARDEALARVAGDLAKVQARAAEAGREQEALDARLRALAPLAEARRHSRWWSAAWWRSLFRGNVLAQATEAEASRQRPRDELQALEQQKQQLLTEQDREKECYAAERSRQVEAERRRRHAGRDTAEAAWEHEDQQVRAKWQAACAELQPETAAPVAPTPEAVDSAAEAWDRTLHQEAELAAFARQWAVCLEETADTFPQRLLGLCNLVAGATGALAADPHFGESAASPVRFDLLILEDADRVTEAEFLAVARRARRCVLVGQPPAVPVPGPTKPSRAPALRPALFHRLWQQLHCDPRRLPYAWVRDNGGLCCQLRPVTPEQSQWLESEPLADSPDIELRILAMPRSEPLLAEVVFPAGVPIDRAKEYIFRELQELPVAAAGRSLRWLEDDDRIVLRLADAPAPDGVAICLEAGVRETLHPGPEDAAGRPPSGSAWQTCCVEFDRRAGWHRQRAEEWVQRHLGLRDLGRTARLDLAYRMQPGLAAFLSELLFGGEYRLPGGADAAGLSGLPVVEFVPVPALHENLKQPAGAVYTGRAGGRGRSAQGLSTAAPPRKGGAGLELDLSDGRHRDRLPSEHRAALPDAGLVNYFEALAIRHALEALAAEATARAARPVVGVIALYPAQAELIRRLVQQLPALAAALDVRVGVPGSFQEDECSVVLLGLTRSHGHRAVSFGDGPHALALALTRARSRVIVFGDLGTLQRRCQWQNPLDHLDEAASAREHDVISRLVGYVQGQGRHPHLFQVREGSPA